MRKGRNQIRVVNSSSRNLAELGTDSFLLTMPETSIDQATGNSNGKRSPSPTATSTEAPSKIARTDEAPPRADVPMGNAESQEPELAAEQDLTAAALDQEPSAAPRPRASGVKPEELPALTQRYADKEDDFERPSGPTVYPHNALLNDKIILW